VISPTVAGLSPAFGTTTIYLGKETVLRKFEFVEYARVSRLTENRRVIGS
jgi:hypothetical protein